MTENVKSTLKDEQELKQRIVKCPACGRDVQFTLDQVGSSINCPGCGLTINLIGDNPSQMFDA
ncbi:MAG: hypothetical protein FWG97_05160 [Deltaproteobacteria bacterium]|nr:hypothetical protein [Deltaproteobacteria bacterium]